MVNIMHGIIDNFAEEINKNYERKSRRSRKSMK
jgi:hypothetical protein